MSSAVEVVIAGRRSIRQFLPDPVPASVLRALIAAAARAPSAHNRQPWRFRILRDLTEKSALARAMGERLAADRGRDGDDPASIGQDVTRSSLRITGAPVVVVVSATLEEMDRYPDARRNDAEFLMAVQSTAMAAQNFLLAAHARGLGCCWVCAPLFCPDTVRMALDLPTAWQPQGLILLGAPVGYGRFRDRKTLSEITIGLGQP